MQVTSSSNHGIIDIGSNGVRMIIGRINSKGKIRRELKRREPIRLGQEAFFDDRRISNDSIGRLTQAFNGFKERFVEHEVESVRAVATSALRQASNQEDVLDKVWEQTGISIDVINGEEEARLISKAVLQALDLNQGSALTMDIGGGSVEFNLIKKGELRQNMSFEAGTVRMLDRVCSENYRRTPLENEFHIAFRENLETLAKGLKTKKVDTFVGTGGNLERIGKLKCLIFDVAQVKTVSFEELEVLTDEVFSRSFEERINELGMREDRADVILPAVAITRSVMKRFGLKELQIPRVGLRDGVLVDLALTEKTASL